MNDLRPAIDASGPLTAVGRIVQAGRRQAVAEGRIIDVAHRHCATASTTCLPIESTGRDRSERAA